MKLMAQKLRYDESTRFFAALHIIDDFYDNQQPVCEFLKSLTYYQDLKQLANEEAAYWIENWSNIPMNIMPYINLEAVGKDIIEKAGGNICQIKDMSIVVKVG